MSITHLDPVALAALFAVIYAVILTREYAKTKVAAAAEREELSRRFREAANQLDDMTAQYDTLVEQSGIGILVLDANGVILRTNSKAAEWLNVAIPSLIGRTLLEATLSNELELLFAGARKAGCVRRELRMPGLASDSDLVVTIAAVDTRSMPRRYVLIAENVTQLRRLETVRRDFVANVSHELRTPLTSIRAVAETLQQGALQDRPLMDRFLNMIITESERLTRISDDLLTLSTVESRPPVKSKLNLTALINTVVHRVQRQADKAGIELQSNVPPELFVPANHDQIEQVVVNLIDNAIKYTQEGGRVIVAADGNGESVFLHVSDTGIGIMHQDLPRIFERFYRVDRARSRETGGTGLGLSIVKHIIEAHGGQVLVESEFNHGSTFTVSLPIIEHDLRTEEGIVSN